MRLTLCALAAVCSASTALAQCDEFLFGYMDADVDTAVVALAAVDHGDGTWIYAAGNFTRVEGVPIEFLVRTRGLYWEPLPVPDANNVITCLASSDGVLYAGGSFTEIGGRLINRVARFDGKGWSDMAGGVTGPGTIAVKALAIEEGGSLLVGGQFKKAGDISTENIARWTGSEWKSFAGGVNGDVVALVPGDDGVYIAGQFNKSASGVAMLAVGHWKSAGVWEAVTPGGTRGGSVTVLEMFQGLLCAGGTFTHIGGTEARSLAAYNASARTWHYFEGRSTDAPVTALRTHTDSASESLFVGSANPSGEGGVIETWDGEWWPLEGAGMSGGDTAVHALLSVPSASSFSLIMPGLYCGGAWDYVNGGDHDDIAVYGCDRRCIPDCNRDGRLNINDFICFRDMYAKGRAYGDFKTDGLFNINDFVAFQAAFVRGCF